MAKVEAGTVVGGKYRLDAPIGEGGMASVWRAVHTTLESAVAVKFLEVYGSNAEELKQRFLREAKLAANLKHRNVIHILDFGVLEGQQQLYMIMELLEGESLGDRLESGQDLDEVQMMELVAQLLGGLAAVHDAGIVHRDVKPDNVFLVRDADGEYPKLLDFGISKSKGSARVTQTGAVVGTPAYMSPEQAMGHEDLDPRADLFSVGVMLYEIFTGVIPFESKRMGEIMIRVATEDMPPLSRHRPDLPDAVQEVVMRAVARDRDARWPDARAMRDALLEAADVLASSPRRGGRPSRLPSERHPRTGPHGATTVTPSVERPRVGGPPRGLIFGLAVGAVLVLGVGAAVVASALRDPEGGAVDAADVDVTAAPEPAEPEPDPTEDEPGATERDDVEVEAAADAAGDPSEPAVVEPEVAAQAVVEAPAPSRGPRPRPAPAASPSPTPAPTPAASPSPAASPAPRARPAPAPEPAPTGGFMRELDY